MLTMTSVTNFEGFVACNGKASRSHSAQGLGSVISSPGMKIPLPPRLWITDVEDESSDGAESNDLSTDRVRVRSRFRHYKQRSSIPIGIFWDIENCQVPRGCSAIDVVAAIRNKFLTGRREADFVVVCDVRKESAYRLQELNDAQISLIHVCGTQKNAADEKLRQCMRRFGELHSAPAALLLISGDINFAADLSDFRHRKNMEVILVHKQNTSSALIACASSHHNFNDLTAHLPRNPKTISQTEEDEKPTCEMEVVNLPHEQPAERVSRRLRRLADNCGGKVLQLNSTTAILRFPTPDHASRALKRMDGEDVFGRKISTRYARSLFQPAYSSDEGYSTAPAAVQPPPRPFIPQHQMCMSGVEPPVEPVAKESVASVGGVGASVNGGAGDVGEWALALQQLPAPTPPPLDFCPPPAPRPRKIRGTHGTYQCSVNLDRSGCSSSSANSVDDSRRELSQSRAASPWNCSGSFSEHSEGDDCIAEITVSNLPPYEPLVLQEMLTQLFAQYVPVVRVSVWAAAEGPLATVVLRSEWDARLAIARVHKRRLDNQWTGRRLELSLGRPSPAPNLDVLRARLRAILLDQKNHQLPLVRLRDAYASRHCCALTTSDLSKIKDTVVIHDGFGRMVQLVDLSPVISFDMEEAPWKCHIHTALSTNHEDGSHMLRPVYMEINALANNVQMLLESHGGVLPLLSFVECYEAVFGALRTEPRLGVALELLLRSAPQLELKDAPSRHLVWRAPRTDTPPATHSDSSRSSSERERPRTAPALEPMLTLFERELIDLLKSAPRCCINFSKLIPSFHHHFGRQCRVADYGFTKLPDLLAALSNTIVVLGSGSSRVITLSAAAQARRWTSDLVKLLKAQPGRAILPQDIPQLYQATFGRPFSTVDYGVCTVQELMLRVAPDTVVVGADGSLSLPRRTPTPEERARTVQFAKEAVELLCYTPNLRMEFSRFVPAYHAHFGRQLRVAHYGCVKLVELFELIPEWVVVGFEHNSERSVRLAPKVARPVIAQRLQALAPCPLAALPSLYAAQFGAPPAPCALGARSLLALVYAGGGCVERGEVRAPASPAAARWAAAALAAAAALVADRSVARGSTLEYFESACRRIAGAAPDLRALAAAGVVQVSAGGRLLLTPAWRAVWRVAGVLAERGPLHPDDILREYNRKYQPDFHTEMDEDMTTFLYGTLAVWCEEGAGGAGVGGPGGAGAGGTGTGRWALRPGVVVPRAAPPPPPPTVDYSLYDTPPGQKGSRVFESPKTNIWCSPPASALPTPTALLAHDTKRRTRLAAQFDI